MAASRLSKAAPQPRRAPWIPLGPVLLASPADVDAGSVNWQAFKSLRAPRKLLGCPWSPWLSLWGVALGIQSTCSFLKRWACRSPRPLFHMFKNLFQKLGPENRGQAHAHACQIRAQRYLIVIYFLAFPHRRRTPIGGAGVWQTLLPGSALSTIRYVGFDYNATKCRWPTSARTTGCGDARGPAMLLCCFFILVLTEAVFQVPLHYLSGLAGHPISPFSFPTAVSRAPIMLTATLPTQKAKGPQLVQKGAEAPSFAATAIGVKGRNRGE